MVAAVAAGAAALSAGSQLYGSSQQAGAAKAGQNTELAMFEQLQKLLAPYTSAGASAIPQVQALLGLGPNGSAGIQSTLENLPGYQFALNQGLKSTENSFSARGLGLSGAAVKGADQYSTGLASSNYNTYLSQLMGLMNTGENAAAGVGSAGVGLAPSLAALGVGGATAGAAGLTGAANSLGTGGLLAMLLGGGTGNTGAQNSVNNLINTGYYSGSAPDAISIQSLTGG